MEAALSIICAIGGFLYVLFFLNDLIKLNAASQYPRGTLIKAGIKLMVALLMLHFHFEFDILD